jgi:Inner membrane component of T3SS, cytoplasmic domain
MSFRLFIYYCALCGGWAAFFGWAIGRVLSPTGEVGSAGIKGAFLGLAVALGLSIVDALWNLSLRNIMQVLARVGTAVLIGFVGGLIGGMLGQILYSATGGLGLFLVFGWTLTGMLIGTSIGVFEILSSVIRQADVSGSRKKLLNGLIGGTAGGLLGGILALLLRTAWAKIFSDKDPELVWSPTAMGFVALGMCIGLLIGLAQVILKEAWVKIESGRRAGKEMILSKEKTTIGRAESCDIGLFGDNAIERLHAYILMSGNQYYLEDAKTPAGTYVNDQPVVGRVPLRSGDRIRVGASVLCFRERQKRRQANGR